MQTFCVWLGALRESISFLKKLKPRKHKNFVILGSGWSFVGSMHLLVYLFVACSRICSYSQMKFPPIIYPDVAMNIDWHTKTLCQK